MTTTTHRRTGSTPENAGTLPAETPLVSIGMPLYNAEKYLEQALESLLSQDFTDFTIVISDNASTDRTQAICEQYAMKDSRIQYHRNEKNRGILYNFTHILEMAESEYFMWAAYDDLWDPRFLSTMVRLLQANQTAVVAFPSAVIFDDTHPEIPDHPHLKDYPFMYQFSSKNVSRRLRLYLEAGDGKANLCCGLIRTKMIKDAGGFRHLGLIGYAPDFLLFFRLLSFNEAVSCNEVLFYKRAAPKQDDPALISRIRRFCHNHLGRLDCFLAYLPLIWMADVPLKEKISLALLVFRKIFQWLLSGLAADLARLARIIMTAFRGSNP